MEDSGPAIVARQRRFYLLIDPVVRNRQVSLSEAGFAPPWNRRRREYPEKRLGNRLNTRSSELGAIGVPGRLLSLHFIHRAIGLRHQIFN